MERVVASTTWTGLDIRKKSTTDQDYELHGCSGAGKPLQLEALQNFHPLKGSGRNEAHET